MKYWLIFLLTLSAHAQDLATAEGLAAYGTNAPASGGGGGSDYTTGLGAWWKADSVSQSDSTAVALAPDASGNGHDMIGGYDGFNNNPHGNTQWPLIKNAVVNGHNAFSFDGVGQEFGTNVSATMFGSATTNTTFIVIKQDSSQAEACTLFWSGATYGFGIYATYDDAILYDYPFDSGSGRLSESQPVGWDDTWHILACRSTGTKREIFVDGTSIGSITTSSTFFTSGTGDAIIGSVNFGNTALFKGLIAEIRVYQVDPDTNMAVIWTALGTKYGITTH